MQLSRGVSLSSAFCLWHGHCAVAHWLKDTLISSLGIWHVFSKEGPPPTHFVHPHTHCWPSFRMPLTVSRRMICGMISATTCWPATDLWWQLGSSRTACFTASVWFLWPPPPTHTHPYLVIQCTFPNIISLSHSCPPSPSGDPSCWI